MAPQFYDIKAWWKVHTIYLQSTKDFINSSRGGQPLNVVEFATFPQLYLECNKDLTTSFIT